MDTQLYSLLVVLTALFANISLLFISQSFPRLSDSLSHAPSCSPDPSSYDRIASLELSLSSRETEISELRERISELQTRLSSAQRIQRRTEQVLASAKDELSQCMSSGRTSANPTPSEDVVTTSRVEAVPRRASPDFGSQSVTPSRYDWSSSPHYLEESVRKSPPGKSDMNTDVTIVILCGNCTMRTKYPSESIDILNRWYPLVKIYLEGPNDATASSKLLASLGEVKTRYVLVVDASVEFTHNSNLARLRSLLQSGQVHVATPMTEDASTSELFSQCFDYAYHSHTLRIRRGYAEVLSGNSVLCARGGPYFMAATETLRQMWPRQPFPPSLALEAFYLELRSFDMRVGFCPGSILRSNVIRAYNPSREVDAEACNVFAQALDSLDELSKKAFAAKYHVSRLVYADGSAVYLPEPVYELHELSYTYHAASFYREQRSMLFAASTIMERHALPLFLMDDELMAAVLLGVPFPWADNIQMHILDPPGVVFTRTHAAEPADESALRLLRPQ